MKETVTDYETVEKQREVYRSDMSGVELDEDDRVELHANPTVEIREPAFGTVYRVNPVDNPRAKFTSDGVIHLSRSEASELTDMDAEEFGQALNEFTARVTTSTEKRGTAEFGTLEVVGVLFTASAITWSFVAAATGGNSPLLYMLLVLLNAMCFAHYVGRVRRAYHAE